MSSFDSPGGGDEPHGGGPAWGSPPQPAGGPGGRPRRDRLRLALALLVTAVLAGTIGGGIVAAQHGLEAAAAAGGPPVAASPAPVAATTSDARAALAKITPSVVTINTTIEGGGPFGRGGGSGAGTGIIVGASGEVVTNAHVVANAGTIRVQVPGHNGTVTARVVGSDASADLALLRLSGVSDLPVATFAASSTVHVGDPVLAVGNAEGYGGAPTVTEGIISALDRDLPSDSDASGPLRGLLQTDAALNPGNSGGALVDTAGRVVGVTTAVAGGQRGTQAQSIGFAIPSDTVTKALPDLRSGRRVGPSANASPTAFLGVELTDSGASGAQVGAVEPGSPADGAGLRAGDVITSADGSDVGGAADLRAVIAKHKPGDRISLSWRPGGQGQTRTATVRLASRPTTG
ncbi:MAG TPA: trypsin-like peptidase domain-containing protein [Actinomycetes bacterium]